MDMSQYHDLFLTEAREHLKNISALAVALESDHTDKPTIDSLFRSAHSVKGMAASMGFDTVADVAHKMEDLMDRVRKGITVDAGLFDLLLEGEAMLSKMLADIADGGSGNLEGGDLLAKITAYPDEFTHPPEARQSAEAAPEQIPIELSLEESLAMQTVKVKTAVLDRFLDTTGELITVKHRLTMLAKNSRNYETSAALRSLDKHLRELHDQVMAIRLMPLSLVTERFPRMVRDLARKSGKEITFAIKGAEIELDRSILELLGDPLAHLLRNAVDHGIETTSARTGKGKSPGGKITVSITRQKDQVVINIEDDGSGIDPEKIVAAAITKGFLSKEKCATLTADEKLLLICHPGFSTTEKVTSVSGRGVGMDVVRTAIQCMGGSLSIASEAGKGSSFLLRLPLTIAIINVLLVKVGTFTIALPLTAVNTTMELKTEDLVAMDGGEFFFLGDETIPIVPLSQLLNLPGNRHNKESIQLFVTELKGCKTGIQVDQLLGNQEVFVKPLHRPLTALHRINGATVLGNGEIVFIIDILSKIL